MRWLRAAAPQVRHTRGALGARFQAMRRRRRAAADPVADSTVRGLFENKPEAFDEWAVRWRQRMAAEPMDGAARKAAMDAALRHDCLWVRRIAMIHQLGWRLETDKDRLFGYAETLAPERDFFIRKAIGWALRDYARWNPQAVREFVATMGSRLSPLSAREATRRIA